MSAGIGDLRQLSEDIGWWLGTPRESLGLIMTGTLDGFHYRIAKFITAIITGDPGQWFTMNESTG